MKKENKIFTQILLQNFFKALLILIISFLNSCTCEEPIPGPPDEYGMKLSQYGITWYFDKEYQYGQFANGDYYVVADTDGIVKIIYIDPTSSSRAKRQMNGSQLNPVPMHLNAYGTPLHGYDSLLAGNGYTSSLNVGLDVTSDNPLALSAECSLVSTISIERFGRPQLSDAAVLTILSTVPPDGSFRPPYCGSEKTIQFNLSDIDYSILPASLSQSNISHKLSAADVERDCAILKRCWIDHFMHHGEGTSHTSPKNNMPNYGREYSILIGRSSLLACMSDAELTSNFGITRKDILIGLIQIGIDTYEVLKNGGCWPNNGGQNQGRKWPIMFAGALLGGTDPTANPGDIAYDMLHVMDFNFIPQHFSGGVNQMTTPFAEDQTVFYVSQYDYDATHLAYWSDQSHTPYIGADIRADEAIPYETTDLGLPEWGIERMTKPSSSNKEWLTSYRCCCTATGYAGIALVVRILETTASTMTLWGNNAFFDYLDRYMAITSRGSYDRCASSFTEDMWDKYRADYGDGYIGHVYINGTTVITNCVNPITGYDGINGTKDSGTTDVNAGFAINNSIFSVNSGFIGTRYEQVDAYHYRIYGNCSLYGITK